MEQKKRKQEIIITGIIIGVLFLAAVVSFAWISGIASSEDNFSGTYAALDAKRTTVTELMGVTAASSTAITLLPGDAGTPIAEQMADLYYHLMVMMVCKEVSPETLGDALDRRNGKTGNLKQFHKTDKNT